MTYNLRPVIEEIQRSAEDSGDRRNLKMCLGMLKSMRNRCDQNFVAYRKVCLQQPINSGSFLMSF
jgi:[histone H3]-lysine4 N-trimethyltransferase ATXR3